MMRIDTFPSYEKGKGEKRWARGPPVVKSLGLANEGSQWISPGLTGPLGVLSSDTEEFAVSRDGLSS